MVACLLMFFLYVKQMKTTLLREPSAADLVSNTMETCDIPLSKAYNILHSRCTMIYTWIFQPTILDLQGLDGSWGFLNERFEENVV